MTFGNNEKSQIKGICVRFQTAPKESHYIVKRILRYLVGTTIVGLWYKKGSHFNLMAYCTRIASGSLLFVNSRRCFLETKSKNPLASGR